MGSVVVKERVTPMMAQWHACKAGSKGALLFFRMGDFYEAFYDDAVLIAKELELTLTKRQGIAMCGVPHHTCDSYVDRLVGKGHRVAVAEQMEDPKKTKGLVKREVTRVVSPGTLVNSSLLSEKSNNFFGAITSVDGVYGFSFLDLTTSEFKTIEFEDIKGLSNELHRLRPAELLISEGWREDNREFLDDITKTFSCAVNAQEAWHFDYISSSRFLTDHFGVHNLDGYGLKGCDAAVIAAGTLLRYLCEEQCLPIDHIKGIATYSTSEFMVLDHITQRNLELTESLNDGSRKNTLLDVLDNTTTPMGGRLIRHWIKQPLLSCDGVSSRHDAVEALYSNTAVLSSLHESLSSVRDLERLMMKVSAGYASPRDLVTLRFSLEQVPGIKSSLGGISSELLDEHKGSLHSFSEVTELIGAAFVEEPPARLIDGGVIREGYHQELDELRGIRKNSKSWLAEYQASLRESTGIKTLKIGYTRVFGYYIDVSKAQAGKMPEGFQRRQTLVNNERFISPELKEYEEKALSAEERIAALENELFVMVRLEVAKHCDAIFAMAHALAHIDALHSFATAARNNRYIRPVIDDSDKVSITGGRHPVIEASMVGEKFIPNDALLDGDDNKLLVITGPNMAGKSTYIRQVALIAIMAQMGSFVPAVAAHLGGIDKVFTRIGASDDLSRGQSTFMVEMTETANILNNATSKSLVILDEIGRGTSTYDGISLAWAVAEHLLTAEGRQSKTLFATHYWELTKLEEKIAGAVNYNVAIRERDDDIVFLRKIVRGSTDKSYGIHVALLAGLPDDVIDRAREILLHLEDNASKETTFDTAEALDNVFATKIKNNDKEMQLLLFEPSDKMSRDEQRALFLLKDVDINEMTPMQALEKLAEIKDKLSKK
ncbi:MAG: DNA mismatch repair protein MutS [Waddliaceae bacterium]|nr:DNA mismatch repair protein MutS [Waddliaceae bacterium]MBT3579282.1 DNA mismatch repair protein MutS [Waddliaceae bacterium]MBT4445597.1 DNA mismatch repair protein MutS [Waddliaceae bacterium]MBT6928449.1 DNA mismatch repair protein MutS [Waddliaceae bacterium]